MGANVIIGGSSRSGKTTLIQLINQSSSSIHKGFPVEGLFRSFINKRPIFFDIRKKLILDRYLQTPRNITDKKTKVALPIDYYNQKLDDIIKNIPGSVNNNILLLNYCYEAFAQESGKDFWAACDTYPEFLFEKMKKKLPELKLICLIRDPREVISAGLYWRTYPKRSKGKPDKLKYRLMMWLLSVNCIIKLSKKFKDDICIIYFNSNINSKSLKIRESDYSKYFKKYFKNKTPHYEYKQGEFYSQDGKWVSMLNETEINFIEAFCHKYLKIKNKKKLPISLQIFSFKIILVLSIFLSNISYNTSRNFIGFIYAFNFKKIFLSFLESVQLFFKDLNYIIKNNSVRMGKK